MIYCENKKFLFVHVPKTAGTSIRSLLQKSYTNIINGSFVKGDWNYHHAKASDFKKHFGDKWDNIYKFAFVRNPWDWLVSYYHYAMQSQDISKSPDKDTKIWLNNMKQANTFDEFIYRDSLLPYPQYLWVTDYYDPNSIIVDYVGKIETLNEDFDIIKEQANLKLPKLPVTNKSSHNHYSSYYTKSMIKRVEDRYSLDISMFNYKFEKN